MQAGSSGLVMPARISSFGNLMTWCIGASRACLTFRASRTIRISSWVWRGPANACGFPIIIRKVTRVVAERSSCTGPARFSTMMIPIILMMACTAPCYGEPPLISRSRRTNTVVCLLIRAAIPSIPPWCSVRCLTVWFVRTVSPKTTLSAMAFGWTPPMPVVGGSRMRSGPACRNISVPVMCRTAILEAWRGRRCLQTITMMARMRMNGICSWT